MSNYHYDEIPDAPMTLEDGNTLTIRIVQERDFYKGLLLSEYSAEDLEEMFKSYMTRKSQR